MTDSDAFDWNDMPPEVQQMVVEKCDFITRNSLRASSKSLKHIVECSKLYIPAVTIKAKGRDMKLSFAFRLFEEERTITYESINIEEGEGKTSVDLALKHFRNVCLSKRVTIGRLFVETNDDSVEHTEKMEKLLRTSEIPKIFSISWRGSKGSRLVWKILEYCNSEFLTDFQVFGDQPDTIPLFEKVDKAILNNLKRLTVSDDVDATDDDVLALKASEIHLQSEKFTKKLGTEMLRRIMEKPEIGMSIILKTVNESQLLESVPDGFQSDVKRLKTNAAYILHVSDEKSIVLCIDRFGIAVDVVSTESPHVAHLYQTRHFCVTRRHCGCPTPMFICEDDDDWMDPYCSDSDDYYNEYDDYEWQDNGWDSNHEWNSNDDDDF